MIFRLRNLIVFTMPYFDRVLIMLSDFIVMFPILLTSINERLLNLYERTNPMFTCSFLFTFFVYQTNKYSVQAFRTVDNFES
ncbi:hypothetical protein L2E82_14558 [Cichorium intybus]|uniref:Uncharacterized protein n=1 Tax=Cichorium intybus TaxID=13427 RepID=A0ACB9F1L8_CICIN|nr:hypothetical protein L2E82_14558 [Cichorium intybus]